KILFSVLYTLCTLSFFTHSSCKEGVNSDSQNDDPPVPIEGNYRLTPAYPALSFTRPVDYQHAGDGSNRVFVVEQRGVISVFEDNPDVDDKKEFLNIEDQVDDSSNEMGLLGLAFHPDYQNNGYFYVNYTTDNPRRTHISRFQVSPDNPDQAV